MPESDVMHEPIEIFDDRLVIHRSRLIPYTEYRFKFIDADMIAILRNGKVDVYEAEDSVDREIK